MLLGFIDSTAKNSGQRLDNVNRTHLALASGKLVVQKTRWLTAWRCFSADSGGCDAARDASSRRRPRRPNTSTEPDKRRHRTSRRRRKRRRQKVKRQISTLLLLMLMLLFFLPDVVHLISHRHVLFCINSFHRRWRRRWWRRWRRRWRRQSSAASQTKAPRERNTIRSRNFFSTGDSRFVLRHFLQIALRTIFIFLKNQFNEVTLISNFTSFGSNERKLRSLTFKRKTFRTKFIFFNFSSTCSSSRRCSADTEIFDGAPSTTS